MKNWIYKGGLPGNNSRINQIIKTRTRRMEATTNALATLVSIFSNERMFI